MRKIFYLLSMCFMFTICSISARAETSDDLLKIYGKSYNLPDTSETIASIEDVQFDIQSMESVKTHNEKYNESLDRFNKMQTEKLQAANKDIGILSNRNKDLVEYIETNLATAEWSKLLKADKEYKSNLIKMNEIAESMNNITFMDNYKNTEFDIASLYNQLNGLEEDLRISMEAEEIGEVSNIQWVLDNEMHITSKFGYRLDPITKDRVSYHSGVDYRAAVGTPLKALFHGVVLDCGYSSSAGNYITVLVNDRLKYFACHLSEIKVEKGQEVKQYDVIGLTGNTGYRTTGPHLHLALYIDGVAVDVSKIYN